MSHTDLPEESGIQEEILEYSDIVRLPVGIEDGGARYREVVIDEMMGIDHHLMTGKKARGNGAIGLSLVLCRCIQEIPGLVENKGDPERLLDRNLIKKMVQPDRDFLFTRIKLLSGESTGILAGKCPRCREPYEEEVNLKELPIIEWPDNAPLQLEFTLEVGHIERDRSTKKPITAHRKGVLRFPTGFEQEAVGKMDNGVQIQDSMLAACITKLGSLSSVSMEMVKRFKDRDRAILMDVIKYELPGMRQWKSVQCECGREFDIVLDIASFFEGQRRRVSKS
jgi:hypothetical protein